MLGTGKSEQAAQECHKLIPYACMADGEASGLPTSGGLWNHEAPYA